MINQHHDVDPVIRDLNRYLVEQEQHDIRREHAEAIAKQEFSQLGYTEILEYQNDYRSLEMLFEAVKLDNLVKAKAALNAFIEGVREIYLENRTREIEKKEEKERIDDFDLYYLNTEKWC